MTGRSVFGRLAVVAALLATAAPLRADPMYSVDILSQQYYPQLWDAWMTRINDSGVAAGYIATVSSNGPFFPTTYGGGGAFQTLPGLQSELYFASVAGISNNGVVAGTLFDANFTGSSYVSRNGVVTPLLPDSLVMGVSRGGTVYGFTIDPTTGAAAVFTQTTGPGTPLAISGPGVTQAQPVNGDSLNDAGLLAVIGFNDDFSLFGTFLYHIPTGTLRELQNPSPADYVDLGVLQVLEDGRVFGYLLDANFDLRYAFWNSDGTFAGFVTVPAGLGSVRFNDVGLAIGLLDGVPQLYDGASWRPQSLPALNGYQLRSIDDFNDRGEFVGLAAQPGGGFLWGYVARPVPEPATWLLFGGIAVGGWAARRRS